MFDSLKKNLDFQNVYKNGKIIGNRDFTLRYLRTDRPDNRLGIVVSKKVSKRAVVRNRLRRQIKSYYRQLDGELKQGYDFILSAKPACAERSYDTLTRSIKHLFFKKNLIL